MQPVSESQNSTNITATTTFANAKGLIGIFVSSASGSPTLKVADGATTKVNTFTPVAGIFYPFPATISSTTGLVVTVGATLDACVFWN